MHFWIYPLLALAGFVTGFVNTLAGSGSVVTLFVLNLAGLPLDIANATTRVGIVMQTATATLRFRKQGRLTIRPYIGMILPVAVGGILGALLAEQVTAEILRRSIGICMLVILALLFVKPDRWLQGDSTGLRNHPGPLQVGAFFLVGLYGGYVQVAVGVFMLTTLVLAVGFDLVRGNAVKVMLVFCIACPSLTVFALRGMVRWDLGLTMAFGSMLGAWAATYEAAKRGAPFIRILLIVVVVVSAVRYLFF
ncbi:MAG: sulfite exporter TauE/SafE family protein [Kiritimatiellales bacterium]